MNDDSIPEENELISGFAAFQLDAAILKALNKMNFQEPSSIQAQAIPLIQQGKDLIALAQTGSGKQQLVRFLFVIA